MASRAKLKCFIIFASWCFAIATNPCQATQPSMQELLERDFLDDYYSNVVLGYRIVTETSQYAARYTGNQLSCKNCHLNAGTQKDAIPLNVAGMYPKWRSKNGVRNGIGLRIRECFLYSQNGIMPPENSPEVLAVAAYINYLSDGQTIGKPPEGMGVPTVAETGQDPNPANGKTTYDMKCKACHGENGEGIGPIPPLWGPGSYNLGAGMHNNSKAAGFIWANMPFGSGRSLSAQEAWDVASYINLQHRPEDPRKGPIAKLFDTIYTRIFSLIRQVKGKP